MKPLDERLERHISKLATVGNRPDGSISRIAYSDEESAAMAYVRSEGESFGLVGTYDAVGNLFLRWPVPTERRFLVGSHLDSVPQGGNYDGAGGVLAGLEALRTLRERGVELETGIDLVAWRGEEYTFNAVYKGSAAAFGLSEPHILHNTYGNRTLRESILQQGYSPISIDEGRPTLGRADIDGLSGYLELHIEQGVRLEQERADIGVVTSIAGDRRFLVVLEGRFDHSGATPMGTRYRSDVNLAMAYIQTRIDELGRSYRRDDSVEFTQTVGIVNADPEIDRKYPDVHGNSVTKVSGLGYFTLDIMSPDDGFMDAYAAEVHRLIWRTAKEFGVKAVIDQTDVSAGLPGLDPRIRSVVREASDRLGYRALEMPSGAGHDTVMVAHARRSDGSSIPVGMIFVPCRHGISHHRDEYVSPVQLARGTEVLTEAMTALAVGAERPPALAGGTLRD